MTKGTISVKELPDISKEHWMRMVPPQGFSKIEVWMTNWLLYGINRGWIDMDDVVKAMEVTKNERS